MDETTLLSLSIEELYKVFIAKAKDLKESEGQDNMPLITNKDIERVRYGINIKFSLNKYFKYKDSYEYGIFRVKPKSNQIKADSNGFVDMDKFNEEIEDRQAIMLNALLEFYCIDNDIIKMDTGDMGE